MMTKIFNQNIILLFCILTILVGGTQSANAWSIEAYLFDDNDVRVPYCSVQNKYDQGVTVFYAKDLRQTEKFLFGFRLDILERGKDYPVTLAFEKKGQPPLFVEMKGTALQNDLLKIDFNSDDVLKGDNLGNFQRLTVIGMDKSMLNLNLGEKWPAILEEMGLCVADLADQKIAALDRVAEVETQKKDKNAVFTKQDSDPNPIKDLLYLAKIPFSEISDVVRDEATDTDIVTWQSDTVIGVVRDLPFKPSQDIRRKAESFIFEVGQLCSNGYVNDIHATEKVGDLETLRAELACSHAGKQSVTSILFVRNEGDLLIFLNEASADLGADAIKARNDILKAFRKLSL